MNETHKEMPPIRQVSEKPTSKEAIFLCLPLAKKHLVCRELSQSHEVLKKEKPRSKRSKRWHKFAWVNAFTGATWYQIMTDNSSAIFRALKSYFKKKIHFSTCKVLRRLPVSRSLSKAFLEKTSPKQNEKRKLEF